MSARGSDTTQRSRELRKSATPAEMLLWMRLRSGQLAGAKFRRQMPLGPYFADFASPGWRLVVEIDGSSHEGKEAYDLERDKYMESCGWTVLRFTERQVLADVKSVLDAIAFVVGKD